MRGSAMIPVSYYLKSRVVHEAASGQPHASEANEATARNPGAGVLLSSTYARQTVRIEDLAAEPAELKRELVPMLRAEVRPKNPDIVTWAHALVRETRALMRAVLPLEANELEFIKRLNTTGDIAPELITGDPAMQATIREQRENK